MNHVCKSISALLMLCFLIAACSDDDASTGMGESQLAESYTVSIDGSGPNGPVDLDYVVEKEDVINIEKISLSHSTDGSRLSITINLPINENPSGGEEHIGIALDNIINGESVLDLEEEVTYETCHYTLCAGEEKRAYMDYVIETDNYYYSAANNFNSGSITVIREGDLLKGSFAGTLESDGGTGEVSVNGSFEANMAEDNL